MVPMHAFFTTHERFPCTSGVITIASQVDTLSNLQPLHFAALSGHTAICKLLLENNANVDVLCAEVPYGHGFVLAPAIRYDAGILFTSILPWEWCLVVTRSDGSYPWCVEVHGQ